MRYPVWINLTQDAFNPKALPTAQLGSALFIEAGSVSLKPGTDLTFTPLVETSAKSGDVPSAALQFAQPDEVARQVTPSGKRTIAALVTGRFKTAFPDGAAEGSRAREPGEEGGQARGEGARAGVAQAVEDVVDPDRRR